jgi:UDP-N-acetylglucosamine 4,6-dehydratase
MLNNKSILITGGTGSFGTAFLEHCLKNYKKIKKIVVFSRDELKQYNLAQKFSTKKFRNLRYFLGDIRDMQRLNRALEGIDYVIHAAALKQVSTAEYNPGETIKTNVTGTQNLIEASLNNNVKKIIALSTDKAASPLNLYGATKLCAEKLIVSANNIRGNRSINFSVIRYGNVFGSRGSVLHEFLRQKKNGVLNITDKRMTRFNIELKDSIKLALYALKNSSGGEIFIPKLSSFNIVDLAKAIAPECRLAFKGIRPGEKLHEEMFTESESLSCFENKEMFLIVPGTDNKLRNNYLKSNRWKPNKKILSYNSKENPNFLSIQQLKSLVNKYK